MKTIFTLIALVGTVAGNTLPPTCENSVPPTFDNSIPPTFE